jgi:uncharacterized protein YigE (DUF2233 family)
VKRILLIIIFVSLAWGAYQAWLLPNYEPIIEPTVSPTPTFAIPTKTKTVTTAGETMGYAFIKTPPASIFLISNFTEKKTSDELMTSHACLGGINGGFYDTSLRPLGLFRTNNTTTRGVTQSALINGFFSIKADGTSEISADVPQENTRFSLQNGPLLITDSSTRPLAIKNDEHARRMVAAITSDDAIVFMALFEPEALFDGPLLGDTPEFVKAIAQKESLSIISAINLDGGSASAFYNGDTTLGELTQIGSFFCVKK